jgi:hypothetical protein
MEIRLITHKEDFEKAYNLIDQSEYPLSFYEFTLKHEQYHDKKSVKLIGVFQDSECLGTISYAITPCPHLGRILEIKETHQSNIKGYKALMDFLDTLAKDEGCHAIKINKNKIDRMSVNIFDKIENYLKRIIQ